MAGDLVIKIGVAYMNVHILRDLRLELAWVGINSRPKDRGPRDPKETLNPRIWILL